MEMYKDIEGYEGLYQVSNLGNVKSLKLGKERILRPLKKTDGYLMVQLCKNGIRKNYYLHRLVASAFLSNPNNLPQVNHKDENKANNTVDNLEYCDHTYNNNYGTHNQRMSKTLSKPVLCVETGIVYQSTHDIERKLGFVNQNISSCCNGKYKTAYGYHWQYVEKKKEVI